jgi:hypothetical protein
MNELVTSFLSSVDISVNAVALQVSINLAMIAIVGMVALKTTARVLVWIGVRFGGYVKTYDVVSLGDGHQYKVVKVRFRGVVLENGEGDRIELIPLNTWQGMRKTVIKQHPKHFSKREA